MSQDGQGVMCALERTPPWCGRWVGEDEIIGQSKGRSRWGEGKEGVGEPGPGQGRWEMNWETFERQDMQSVLTVRLGTVRSPAQVTPRSPAQVPVGRMRSVRTW